MHLTKHHGLGNDFLILLDAGADQPITPSAARALCDRRTGVGADGIIRAVPGPAAGGPATDGVIGRGSGGADVPVPDDVVAVMQLSNADGSPAEMSGNGIRCLAQALVMAGWAPGSAIGVLTAAGLRTVRRVVLSDDTPQVGTRLDTFAVDMGTAGRVVEAPEWTGPGMGRVLAVDMGNPHLVIEVEPDAAGPDLVELGESANAKIPGGANVHLVQGVGDGGITIRTYERGVGLTPACGTGACASAVAAQRWGLASGSVPVAMPGGDVLVTVGEPVVLTGPAVFVATVETDVASLAAPAGRGTP